MANMGTSTPGSKGTVSDRRCDADDCELYSAEPNFRPDNGGIRSELTHPEVVSEYDDRISSDRLVFRGAKAASELGFYAEHAEEITRDEHAEFDLRN